MKRACLENLNPKVMGGSPPGLARPRTLESRPSNTSINRAPSVSEMEVFGFHIQSGQRQRQTMALTEVEFVHPVTVGGIVNFLPAV